MSPVAVSAGHVAADRPLHVLALGSCRSRRRTGSCLSVDEDVRRAGRRDGDRGGLVGAAGFRRRGAAGLGRGARRSGRRGGLSSSSPPHAARSRASAAPRLRAAGLPFAGSVASEFASLPPGRLNGIGGTDARAPWFMNLLPRAAVSSAVMAERRAAFGTEDGVREVYAAHGGSCTASRCALAERPGPRRRSRAGDVRAGVAGGRPLRRRPRFAAHVAVRDHPQRRDRSLPGPCRAPDARGRRDGRRRHRPHRRRRSTACSSAWQVEEALRMVSEEHRRALVEVHYRGARTARSRPSSGAGRHGQEPRVLRAEGDAPRARGAGVVR